MNRCFIYVLALLSATALSACEGDPTTRSGGLLNNDSDTINDTDADSDSDTDTDTDTDADGDTETEVLQVVCADTADTETCYCLRMAVVGTFDSAANEKDVGEFVAWLNTKSSAIVTMVQTKPVLDAAFLGNYDVLLFTNQADGTSGPFWTYTADEAAALKSWIEAGGGIITVTGFNGMQTAAEVGAMNSLLQPATGISYNNDQYLSQPEALPDAYCYENAVALDWTTSTHEIALNVKRTAAFWGSSITAPPEAQIVVSVADADSITDNAAVSLELGKGRVFAYADEWPLFSNLWLAGEDHSSVPEEQLQYQQCYDQVAKEWKDPNVFFQHAQFWYNVIEWTAPENDCFTIDEPNIIEID